MIVLKSSDGNSKRLDKRCESDMDKNPGLIDSCVTDANGLSIMKITYNANFGSVITIDAESIETVSFPVKYIHNTPDV